MGALLAGGQTRCRDIPPGLGGVLPAVVLSARLPALSMLLLFGAVAGVSGALAGDLATPGRAALWAWTLCVVSLVVHESAHLWITRSTPTTRGLGAIESNWLQVSCVIPRLAPLHLVGASLAGPVAGALVCLAALPIAPAWIAYGVAFVHLVNLLPFVADGRLALLGFLASFARGVQPQPPRTFSDAAR